MVEQKRRQREKMPDAIRIGRSSDNDVVLPTMNISSHHAKLIVEGEDLILEDLGSTNGTSVGTIENKISRVTVSLDDKIFFGSRGFRVRDIVDMATTVDNRSDSHCRAEHDARVGGWSTGLKLVMASFLLVASTVVVFWLVADRHDSTTVHPSVILRAAEGGARSWDDAPGRPTLGEPQEEPTGETERRLAAGDADGPEAEPRAFVHRNESYILYCRHPRSGLAFQIATVMAIDQRRCVTTANAVKLMLSLIQDGFSDVLVSHPLSGTRKTVVRYAMHPQFLSLDREVADLQTQYEQRVAALQEQPPPLEQVDAIREELIALQEELIRLLDCRTAFDAGSVEIEGELDEVVNVPRGHVRSRPNLSASLVGFPFDPEDALFFDRGRIQPMEYQCRILHVLPGAAAEGAQRLVVTTIDSPEQRVLLGAALFDEHRNWLGIFARPVPQPMIDKLPVPKQYEGMTVFEAVERAQFLSVNRWEWEEL
ncbi:MAG: hypothetical protein KatS3mg111_3588 [Pirellulaceae bacterium]|nr:MAG: hypothetical protein KatS3mg111_3588 [Pirellulaceae bacterium]